MPAATLTLAALRRYAVARTLFPPTSLAAALVELGFLQADPIRAPARAQDLTLRHRVEGYRTGDLALAYPTLALEEGYFVNYGFLPRDAYALLLPRRPRRPWSRAARRRAEALLEFVRERGVVHPREVDAHFAHGRVVNYWGGTSSATTHLLESMQYCGLLRVVRREGGIRLYGAHAPAPAPTDPATRRAQLDQLVDLVVGTYAPLPAASMSALIRRIRYRTPGRPGELQGAVARAKQRLAHARVEGVDWYFPASEAATLREAAVDRRARLLAPFDPLVWDRRRFALLWGWAYRFEAYTPIAKRLRGYYALPLAWGDRVIGWGNLRAPGGKLEAKLGFVGARPRSAAFARALADELARFEVFLAARSPTRSGDSERAARDQ